MSTLLSQCQVKHLTVLRFGPPPEQGPLDNAEIAAIVSEAKQATHVVLQASTAVLGRLLGIEALLQQRRKETPNGEADL